MSFFENFEAIVLSTDNLDNARLFYQNVFDVEWTFEDAVSSMFQIGPLTFVLLERGAAAALTKPREPGGDHSDPRIVFALRVQNADSVCSTLIGKGVCILDGPENRPWGRRTATFADPSGYIWEIAQVLDGG